MSAQGKRVERPYAATMLTRTPTAAAVLAAALLAGSLGLAGCSTGSNATITHTPALQTVGGRQTVRGGTQAAIIVVDSANGLAFPGGPTPAGIMHRIAGILNARRTSATGTATGSCSNGVKSSQTTSATGARTTTTDYYYEPTCATLEAEEIITVDTPAAPATTGSGSITSYDKSGGVRVYQKLSLAANLGDANSDHPNQELISVSSAAAPTVGGTARAGWGASCLGAPNAVTMTCNLAHFGISATATFGEAFTFATSAAATPGGNNIANVSISFYSATGLGVTQSGTSWSVTGANAFNAATGNYGFTSSGSTGSGSMTLTDSLYSYTETATLSPSGLSISIVRPDGPIATATVDAAGTGVLTYSDGATEPIAGNLLGF